MTITITVIITITLITINSNLESAPSTTFHNINIISITSTLAIKQYLLEPLAVLKSWTWNHSYGRQNLGGPASVRRS
jgi:hypothetical protein